MFGKLIQLYFEAFLTLDVKLTTSILIVNLVRKH